MTSLPAAQRNQFDHKNQTDRGNPHSGVKIYIILDRYRLYNGRKTQNYQYNWLNESSKPNVIPRNEPSCREHTFMYIITSHKRFEFLMDDQKR